MRFGVVFPGQGSQSLGMGGAIVERYPVARDLFARAERVLGYDLLAVVRSSSEDDLRETRYAQPAIFVVNYALAASVGPELPVVASAGHSFGEYCSLTLADSLDFEEALGLVSQRALAMQAAAELAPGAMIAVLGLDPEALQRTIERARDEGMGRVQAANFNAPGQIVISGDEAAVARAADLAVAAGAKRAVRLNVSGAWHSELMEPAVARFAPYVERAKVREPRFTVISTVDAKPSRTVAEIRDKLIRSVTAEVLWHAAAERLVAEGLDAIVEFGGSPVLAKLVQRMPDAPPTQHVGNETGVERLRASLADKATA